LAEKLRCSAGVKALSSGFVDFWGQISYLAKFIFGKIILMSKKVEIWNFAKILDPERGSCPRGRIFGPKNR
jgi:hypothetical protein